MRVVRGWILLIVLLAAPGSALGDAVERMKIAHLRAVHASLNALRDERQEMAVPKSEFQDYRAQVHVHTHFSHDSEGSIEEILKAAKACDTQVILFTDHPSADHDFFLEGYKGVRDGVLLIPGAEKDGFLLFPRSSIHGLKFASPQRLADHVGADDGLAFVSHLEERMDWDIRSVTGNEIYNTHADAKDEPRLMATLRNPVQLMALLPAVQQFPQEVFGALLDYPEQYLTRWDQLCQSAPHTGVAANDAHHNQGIRVIVTPEGQLAVEDTLGERVATLDPEKIALLKPLVANRKAGDKVFELDLDPYERSFRHVSTHLLMRDLTESDVWDALKSGRAYVSFEWLADPEGFWFEARQGEQRWPIGSQIELNAAQTQSLEFSAQSPLPVLFKLFCNGKVAQEHRGREFSAQISEPGVYRLEAWLLVAEELKPWILTNPVYVTRP